MAEGHLGADRPGADGGKAASFFESDEVLDLLVVLPARDIAKLRAVNTHLRTAIDEFIDELLAVRGVCSRTTGIERLREMDRHERALFHEDFGFGWRLRWRDGPTAQGINGAVYESIETRDERPPPDELCVRGACTADWPRSYVSLRGGGAMNFNGLYRGFEQPVMPRRISFCVRVPSRCTERAFANVFFSSAPLAHGERAPVPVFFLAQRPEPEDLFTVLLDLKHIQTPDDDAPPPRPEGDEVIGQLWLPTGIAAELRARRPPPAARAHENALDGWARVELELDWAKGLVTPRVVRLADGAAPATSTGGASASTGSATLHAGAAPAAAPAEAQGAPAEVADIGNYEEFIMSLFGLISRPKKDFRFKTPAVENGFTHVYLFVWSEGEMLRTVSEVHFSDLWLET